MISAAGATVPAPAHRPPAAAPTPPAPWLRRTHRRGAPGHVATRAPPPPTPRVRTARAGPLPSVCPARRAPGGARARGSAGGDR